MTERQDAISLQITSKLNKYKQKFMYEMDYMYRLR